VIFTSKRTGQWQLWQVRAEGGEPRRLRANDAMEWQADESPDGRQLALLSNLDGAEALWLMDRASGAARVLIRHGRNMKGGRSILGNPHFSRDGQRIVFSSNWRFGHQIYVAEVATGEATRVSPVESGGCEPRFHPDGKKVVYVSRRLWRSRSRLVELDLATGQERVLVDWPALNYDPVYSSDGTELAFASNVSGEFAIYRLNLRDGRFGRVTSGGGDARNPDYRPAP
jgi:TolB protein